MSEDQERILTPEEEIVVREMSGKQEDLKAALTELENAFGVSEKDLEKIKYKVSNSIALLLMATFAVINLGLPGYVTVANESIAGGLITLLFSMPITAALFAPLAAASYTLESMIRRNNPVNNFKKQDNQTALYDQFNQQMSEYERQVSLSRGIVENAFIRGGAIVEDGKLIPTESQIDAAHREMEEDLTNREQPSE